MSYHYGGWAPYVSVAERRRQAEQVVVKMRKAGRAISPVTIVGRRIATTFWGSAWCDNMEAYRDYETRLPRGRSYIRNSAVVDLQIARGRVTALVYGSELYRVAITIKEAAAAHWRAICADCAGGIDSLVALLQGKFSRPVMERLCRQEGGLFPRPADIRFTCSCPDRALMCKHVAAVLYGIGARLDEQPELLFHLRAVDAADLFAGIDAALSPGKSGIVQGRMLEADDMSALFGIDIAEPTRHQPMVTAASRARNPAKTSAMARIVRPKGTASAKNGASKTSSKRSAAAGRNGAASMSRKVLADRPRSGAKQKHAKPASRCPGKPNRQDG